MAISTFQIPTGTTPLDQDDFAFVSNEIGFKDSLALIVLRGGPFQNNESIGRVSVHNAKVGSVENKALWLEHSFAYGVPQADRLGLKS